VDIYALIRQDHQRVRELLARLESLDAGNEERGRLFATLRRELAAHKEAEERTFYDALAKLPPIGERIEEALEEHVDIDELLQELSELETDSDPFIAQLAELREEVEHHFGEEENEIFPRARDLLSAAEAERLAAAMTAEKDRSTA
jgi:hemerythrin superfamily protein